MLFGSSFPRWGAGFHPKICQTCFCCPACSPTLSFLISIDWPWSRSLSSPSSDMCLSCLGEHSLQECYYSTQLVTGLWIVASLHCVIIYTSNSAKVSVGGIRKSHALIMMNCPCFTGVRKSGDDSRVALRCSEARRLLCSRYAVL